MKKDLRGTRIMTMKTMLKRILKFYFHVATVQNISEIDQIIGLRNIQQQNCQVMSCANMCTSEELLKKSIRS